MTRSPAWARLLGARLPRSAAFDPQNKPYVGLHTPDIEGDPPDSEFATPKASPKISFSPRVDMNRRESTEFGQPAGSG
jgi:hypothetical protein